MHWKTKVRNSLLHLLFHIVYSLFHSSLLFTVNVEYKYINNDHPLRHLAKLHKQKLLMFMY